jgi:CheY-like chemotaxis protein
MKPLYCILLIDDNRATNFLHQTLIEELDMAQQVTVVQNGKEGLSFLEEHQQANSFPELIFVDINMPVMDGYEFLDIYQTRRYNQIKHSLVIILTTSSNPRDTDKVKQLNLPYVHYYVKPLKEEDLQRLAAVYTENSLKQQ